MGSWDAQSTRSYAEYSSVAKNTRSAGELFKSRDLKDTLNPKGVSLRESCDSEINPQSTAIMIGLDVTGSMGNIAHHIAKEGLGVLMGEIMDRKPVTDPHIMFLGIGDVNARDRAPLQCSQFEPDIRIIEQLNDLYVEGAGGGNDTESYDLPWYLAATRTSIDCFNKRGKKGYLFTIGDELFPDGMNLDGAKRIFGDSQIDERVFNEHQTNRLSGVQILDMVQERYDVFHLMIEQGYYARRYPEQVISTWSEHLGKRALLVNDYTKVSEVILSAIQVAEGDDPESVVASWQDVDTSRTVARALGL